MSDVRPLRAAPIPGSMLDLLSARSQEQGAAPAILAPGRAPLSYAALLREVERNGQVLAASGFGRGHRIAVALADGPDAAVAMLSAMCWTTCVPLSAKLDGESCRAMFASMRVDALIAHAGHESPVIAAARDAGLALLRLSSQPGDAAGVFALRTESPLPSVQCTPPLPDDVAVLFHTSGTTTHHRVAALSHARLLWSGAPLPIGRSDRCINVSPLYARSGFGLSLLFALAAGGSTVLTPGFDAERFAGWLEEFAPTWYSAGPTIQAAIVDALAARASPMAHSLRFIRSSSAAMPESLRERLAQTFRVPIVEGYGSTEGGLIAEMPLPPERRRPGSVGLLQNLDMRILGAAGESLPRGEAGEILVRGPGVIDRYENDPEADRLGFHEGWWRTGDVGYLDADDYVYITGRVKEIINRGGLKVAPREVDDVLMRHPAVREAAAFGVAHPTLGEDVVVAVVLNEGASTTARELREHAHRHLAAYKAPSSVVIVGSLPRNALGKVRRQALAVELAGKLHASFVAPRSEDEKMIAGIFSSVLGVESVGALDHFFHLGGDSLGAGRVLQRIAAATGVKLAMFAVFDAPTVEELAERLAAARATMGSG